MDMKEYLIFIVSCEMNMSSHSPGTSIVCNPENWPADVTQVIEISVASHHVSPYVIAIIPNVKDTDR